MEGSTLLPPERSAYFDCGCNDDPSLRSGVESVLQSDEQTVIFVDTATYQMAAEMLLYDMQLKAGCRARRLFRGLLSARGTA